MTLFEVWAPEKTVKLRLAGEDREMVSGDDGWWRLDVPDAGPGADYAYVLPDGDDGRPDPRSAWQPAGVHGPSRVYDHAAFGWTDAQAYAHVGISGMNGYSDQSEITTTAIWTNIRNWANASHIARLAFWSVNRDRGCAGGGIQESCSGLSQSDWAFTQITAGFTG